MKEKEHEHEASLHEKLAIAAVGAICFYFFVKVLFF
jgi:hypothetical protein